MTKFMLASVQRDPLLLLNLCSCVSEHQAAANPASTQVPLLVGHGSGERVQPGGQVVLP